MDEHHEWVRQESIGNERLWCCVKCGANAFDRDLRSQRPCLGDPRKDPWIEANARSSGGA